MISGFNKKAALLLALSLSSSMLISCSEKDADKVGEAQLCLDKATQGTANTCMEKIASIDTPAANLLRCSANFIDEGFTQPSRFKSAFDALSTNSSSNTQAFMSVLAFSSKSSSADNQTYADQTYSYCSKSEAKGFMLLGSMAEAATTLSVLAGSFTSGTQPSSTDITNAINAALGGGNPAAVTAIGAAVTTTYAASCQTGQQANTTLCDQFNTALSGVDTSDASAVGNAVLNYWKNH